MKLYGSETSPYVRKVRVQAIEGGYWEKIAFIEISSPPTAPNLKNVNPLKKVPVLELDDSTVLFDSRVICEFLDTELGGGQAFPSEGLARWRALRMQSLGDGLLDAALLVRYETFLRPKKFSWQDWQNGQMMKIDAALKDFEDNSSELDDSMNIGTITVACMLGYLDFRYPDKVWRNSCPNLANWHNTIMARPSLRETVPSE